MKEFLKALEVQRWDDHRYYHHSRINQSLHFLSALSFLSAYALLFTHPVAAAFVGWFLAMVSRQLGHFFFEPKGFDEMNGVSHEYKEEVKVGYNLRRKIVLLAIYHDPTLLGLLSAPGGEHAYLTRVGEIWLALGIGGLVFRTVHLFFLRDVQTGLVWFTKIVTDPFHDLKLYHKAPLYLLRGELIDPMLHKRAS